MATSLTLDIAPRDRHLHVIATGEIDLSNTDAFKQALASATAEAARSHSALAVDLSGVDYLDSAAINVLYIAAERIDAIIAPPLLMTTLRVSGLAEVIDVEVAT